jgi:hypothetical protein
MKVNLSAYDMAGRLVRIFPDENRPDGDFISNFQLEGQWNASSYIFKLTDEGVEYVSKNDYSNLNYCFNKQKKLAQRI